MVISDITVPFVDGLSIKQRLLAKIATLPPNTVPNTLRVFLVREPFDDFYQIVLDGGRSEELEEEATREWLIAHGAHEDLVQKAITQAWNFYSAAIMIPNPRFPKELTDPLVPLR